MLEDIPVRIYGPAANLTAFSVLILALCLAFCWYQWYFVRAYRPFPSTRLDTKWLWRFIMGRFPKGVPITSIMLQDFVKEAKTFQDEGLFVAWFLRPYIIVYGEQHVKNIMNEDALANKPLPYAVNKLLLGNGLIGSNNELWKSDRKMLDPAFHLSVLKNKMSCLNKHALCLTEMLQKVADQPFEDVWEVLKHCAFQTMAEHAFSLELESERHKPFRERIFKTMDLAAELFMKRLIRPWLYLDFLLPMFRFGNQYLELIKESNRLADEFLNVQLKSTASDADMKSFSSILLKHHLLDPNFTDQDVRDHLLNLTLAGYDTVSGAMMWCLYTLGLHPQEQEKAYEEVQSITPEGDISYEDLCKLKYLDSVVKETLRLLPPVPLYGRKAQKEIQCGKYTIPKDAEVLFFPFMLHRNPNIYLQPEEFHPERFYDNSNILSWMYTPFAEGYRSCLGKKFAMMEMKVQLAHVLRHFQITTLDKIDASELDWNVILKPIKPLRFMFETR